jgi:broad specificity phosphatase PhoE
MTLKNTYYIIRHGECVSNLTNTNDSRGVPENVLTEKGRGQVRSCAEKLVKSGIQFDKIISSPFIRAQESSEILLREIQPHDKDILYTDLLKEMDHGSDQQGKTILSVDGEFRAEDLHKRHGDGETYWEVRERMNKLLQYTEQTYEGKNIILMTHGTPAWMFYSVANNLDEEETITFRNERKREKGFFIKNAVPLVIGKS